jgi:LysM repeat protein
LRRHPAGQKVSQPKQTKPKTNPEGEALLDEVLAKPLDTQEPEKEDSTQKPADQQLVPASAPPDTGKDAPVAGPPAPASLPPSESIATSVNGQDYSYTVKPGETLFSLASRFKNPAANIKEAIGLKEDNVQSGQVVIIKVLAIHKVASGQTLSTLARKYGVSMADIRKANALKAEQINIGQELVIPIP